LDDETRHKLMRKNICFDYRDPWVPGHRCMGKGEIHYIEVAENSVDSEEEEQDSESTSSEDEPEQVEEQPLRRPSTSTRTHRPVVP
jgi:hypothetical protein